MKNKQLKIDKVNQIATDLKSAKSAALFQYQGLNAADTATMRASVKSAGGRLEVTKNSLIIRALEQLGIKLPADLTGPTAITYCDTDEIAPLKELDKINQDKDKTNFKYGIYGGQLLLEEELKKFLSLPSKTVLISQLLGLLNNPLNRLAYALRYNQTRLVLALKAVAEKNKN